MSATHNAIRSARKTYRKALRKACRAYVSLHTLRSHRSRGTVVYDGHGIGKIVHLPGDDGYLAYDEAGRVICRRYDLLEALDALTQRYRALRLIEAEDENARCAHIAQGTVPEARLDAVLDLGRFHEAERRARQERKEPA